jgi:prepilin-type N-terminal cleavage/methylation domain-containing protein
MKDMILAKKAELKKRGYKGFTLMEMLIVVAIIAVLVAIAIPVFTSQLEKSKDAVTIANLRSAYAEAQSAYLTGSNGGNATLTTDKNGVVSVAVSGVAAKGTSEGFNDLEKELPFTAPTNMGGAAGTYTVTFTYGANGAISNVAAAKS